MTLTGIRTWAMRSQAMYMILAEMETQIETLKAHRDLTDSTENRKQSLAIQTDLDRMLRDFDRMVATFLVRVGARDREVGHEKLIDLSIALEAAEKAHKMYRERFATFQFIEAIGGFRSAEVVAPTEEDTLEDTDLADLGKPAREDFWEMVAEAKLNYETQLKLTDDHIPNTVQLIHA